MSGGLFGLSPHVLAAVLYVSAFEPGDLEAFGPDMVTGFARAALAELAPGELDRVTDALDTPGAATVYPDRLDACAAAAATLADTLAAV